MTSNTLAMIQAYLDGGSGSTMEQIIMKQAYGDIVRLTAERDDALQEIDNLQDVCGDAADRMVALCKERDEARRMVCEWHGGLRVQHPQDYAKRRGWDCYKEDGNA